MGDRLKAYLALLFLVVTPALAAPATSQRVHRITGCETFISEPGRYVLATDLSCGGFNAIEIVGAHDVQLNLAGHTIEEGGIYVEASTRVEIQGPGLLLDGNITLVSTSLSTVRNIDVVSGRVSLFVSPGNTVRQVNVEGCDGVIELFRSDGNDLVDNSSVAPAGEGCNEDGIRVEDSDANTLLRNYVSGKFAGIRMLQVSNGNEVQQNELVDNAYGILLEGNANSGNVFESNIALDNAILDLSDPVPCSNVWQRNQFDTDSEGDGPGSGCIQ